MATDLPNLKNVTSSDDFKALLSVDLERVSLINFWATWAEPCKLMNDVVFEIAKTYPSLLVLQVDAESQAEIAESFDIEAVPSFILLRGHTLLGRVSGADATALQSLVVQHAQTAAPFQSNTNEAPAAPAAVPEEKEESLEELNERLRKLMNQSNVVLFMKGEPDAPRCGFSRQIVEVLRTEKVDFTHFDILTDESVRQGLKVYNNWPTFPQLIVKGELVGGLDIVKELVENGELVEVLAN